VNTVNSDKRKWRPAFRTLGPLVVLTALAWSLRSSLAPWAFMWVLAFAIYGGCKWLTFADALQINRRAARWRVIGYLFFWPGMDARQFLYERGPGGRPRRAEWLPALAVTTTGAFVIRPAVSLIHSPHAIIAAWTGMVGVVLVLHFGLFQLLALFWQANGVMAMPVMHNPLCARSLAEFWGHRWNTAFNEIVFRFIYRPIRRRLSVAGSVFIVFVASGLIHDLVISGPARGGYGGPTLYFVVQGLGLLLERKWFRRPSRMTSPGCGWIYTAIFTLGPVPFLFHREFLHTIILPMLADIGAIVR
jgi:hypothetical protein